MVVSSGLPRLYPILDVGLLFRAGVSLEAFALDLREAGIRFIQYRDKDASDTEFLERALLLRRIFPASDSRLILNDRVALWAKSEFDGIHVGQEDLPPVQVRNTVGSEAMIGVSTHNEMQLRAASESPVDYVAIGPVFATSSKLNPDPVVGLEGVRSARRIVSKPLVAIGGITRNNASLVLAAGADSLAVISDLLPRSGIATETLIRDFLLTLDPLQGTV